MEILTAIFFTPFAEMWEGPVFFTEVVLNGLLTGVMYSLVALGFVLIFKASEIFNFAQGIMVLFAALSLVGLMELGIPAWLAVILTLVIMVLLALVIERVMLRPLVNQDPFILFMSTIGLTFFLEGFGETLWGSNVKRLDIGIPKDVIEYQGVLLSQFDIIAAVVGALLVFGLAIFFTKTTIGRALRAVADDHQAALSVGIPLKTIWVIVWSVSGGVALVAGIMWGAKSGVQFSLFAHRAQGAPGADPGRPHLHLGGHRGRSHHRRGGEGRGDLLGAAHRRGDRELVRLHPRPRVPPLPAAGALRRTDHRAGVTER